MAASRRDGIGCSPYLSFALVEHERAAHFRGPQLLRLGLPHALVDEVARRRVFSEVQLTREGRSASVSHRDKST
jgi:hypothetical protein